MWNLYNYLNLVNLTLTIGVALIGPRFGKFQQNQQLYSDYFFCETFGIDPDNTCVLEVDGYTDQCI
jgi:hypothetical protein